MTYPVLTGLSFANWRIGKRRATHYITVHYNGPPVKAFGNPRGEINQLIFDSGYHMRPAVLGADGIQYHWAVLSNGDVYQLRPADDRLWHCGNKEGNPYSEAVHLPLGGTQEPTERQQKALTTLIDDRLRTYDLNPFAIRLHKEWKPTECPGNALSKIVFEYRKRLAHGMPHSWFRTIVDANIRISPDVNSKIVGVCDPQTIVPVSKVIENGVPYRNNPTYIQLADERGYMHISIVQPYRVGAYGVL